MATTFAKRLLHKAIHTHHSQRNERECLTSADLDIRMTVHYGVPSTAAVLAFDPFQSLLAIGTLDGRIKVIGGGNIEGLLISPKTAPYKYLEFLPNQGYLVSITNDNDIQIWDLEVRSIACSLQWESNITAFSVISVSCFMYIGDEHGMISVLKHVIADKELLRTPYHIAANSLAEAAGLSFSNHQPVVGLIPQPCSSGNRVLIAYESGLIVLWDAAKAHVVVVKGDKVLELKDGVVDSPSERSHLSDFSSGQHIEEKEISALCWASSDGSILAVGYVDGDVLFWRTPKFASNDVRGSELSHDNVVKLQLSSAERRLPVIVLHWCQKIKSRNCVDGQLFIYGGDEIGSDEVLTILNLEWSHDMETLKCCGRADVTLDGYFADMILMPSGSAISKNHDSNVAIFVLTSPGHLQYFENDSLFSLACQQDKRFTLSPSECAVVIPTIRPIMTVAKLSSLPLGGNSTPSFSELAIEAGRGSKQNLAGDNWPLSGGVANQSSSENMRTERIYLAGYSDGSVRIWDATSPVLSLLYLIDGQVKGAEVAVSNASVSELELCPLTSQLAVGNQQGLIQIYNLGGSLKETSFHIVTETEHKVQNSPQDGGLHCRAVFRLLDSPVHALRFENYGGKLAVGYECGRVAVFNMNLFSVLILTDLSSSPNSPVMSLIWKSHNIRNGHINSPNTMELEVPNKPAGDSIFVLTKDTKLYCISNCNGNKFSSRPIYSKNESTAISLYIIEGKSSVMLQESSKGSTSSEVDQVETEYPSSPKHGHSGVSFNDSLVLVCCKEKLKLYRLKSLIQGNGKSICKAKLAKSCCWTSAIKKDEKIGGLVLFYQTGDLEVRSLSDLQVVKSASLISILRWNFQGNMVRTMSSTDHGQIVMANGSEVAFLSLLADENDFSIPEFLPCLHDKVLAAAAEASISCFFSPKKKQGGTEFLVNIVKGLKAGKANNATNLSLNPELYFGHLDRVFTRNPFPDPPQTTTDYQEAVELDIDDIVIDEPALIASTSSHKEQNDEKGKRSERERLFDDNIADAMPRLRTREEIIAKYRRAGDASSVAGEAKNKLLERQQKLERISRRTEDLRSGAEDFASLANELVKAMEKRKWWQI